MGNRKSEEARPEKVRPHAIVFDQSLKLTRESFKDECDPNNIVAQYVKTGLVTSIPRVQPQYGDAPDGDFLTSAIVAADIKSRQEAGELDLDEILEKGHTDINPPEEAVQEPSEAPEQENDTTGGDV